RRAGCRPAAAWDCTCGTGRRRSARLSWNRCDRTSDPPRSSTMARKFKFPKPDANKYLRIIRRNGTKPWFCAVSGEYDDTVRHLTCLLIKETGGTETTLSTGVILAWPTQTQGGNPTGRFVIALHGPDHTVFNTTSKYHLRLYPRGHPTKNPLELKNLKVEV